MKEYRVSYKGENYSNIGYFFLGKKTNDFIKIEDGDIPKKIDFIGKVEEDDSKISLKFGHVFFNFTEYEDAEFYEEIDEARTIIFDKTTGRAIGDKFNKTLINFLDVNSSLRASIVSFISRIIDTNENVKRHIEQAPGYAINPNDATFVMNFYNMVVFNLPEYEKLINSNNINFLKNNLPKESFEITEANKLHQVVGLPKFAVNAIKEMKLEEFVDAFKELSAVVDGNSLNIILEFIDRGKLIFDSEYSGDKRHLKKEKLNSFIKNLTKIMERKNYKVTDLLNYFLRQSFYASTAGYFTFPIDEAMYLNDYLNMCEKYGLKIDKYPSQLRKMHDIVAKNIMALERNSPIQDEEFKRAVDIYKNVEREITLSITNDKGEKEEISYTFIVPTCIKDIVQEGNIQHHCVGSYSDMIIAKEARVVFMRDSKDIKTPLVTIDIDANYNLVEAKKAYNEDVDAIHSKAINKWIREIKSL